MMERDEGTVGGNSLGIEADNERAEKLEDYFCSNRYREKDCVEIVSDPLTTVARTYLGWIGTDAGTYEHCPVSSLWQVVPQQTLMRRK